MDALFIVAPAYNEADNIENFIDGWYRVAEGYGDGSRLVIVNDGSRDETGAIIKELMKTRPLLETVDQANGGHGKAVLTGYRYAIEHGASFIFQTDSDGQTDPSEFGSFWDLRNDYDAIIGNRAKRQDGSFRIFTEKVLLLILRVIFGVRIPDSNAPFRLMRRELLEKYIDRLPADYELPNVMLSVFFAYFRENIAFREISFKPRQGGVNSVNVKSIVRTGWKALSDFAEFKRKMNEKV